MKELYYVGLDVHKDSIQMAVLDDRSKEPILAKGLPNRTMRIVKELVGYQEKGKVQIAYEAGSPGYTLYREPGGFGYDCRVIPPNTVFHGGDGQVKTDYRDAVDIAWMLRSLRRAPRLDNRCAVASGVCASSREAACRCAVVPAAQPTRGSMVSAAARRLAYRKLQAEARNRSLSRLANIKDDSSAIGVRLVQAGQPLRGCLRSLRRQPQGGWLTANSRPKRVPTAIDRMSTDGRYFG